MSNPLTPLCDLPNPAEVLGEKPLFKSYVLMQEKNKIKKRKRKLKGDGREINALPGCNFKIH